MANENVEMLRKTVPALLDEMVRIRRLNDVRVDHWSTLTNGYAELILDAPTNVGGRAKIWISALAEGLMDADSFAFTDGFLGMAPERIAKLDPWNRGALRLARVAFEACAYAAKGSELIYDDPNKQTLRRVDWKKMVRVTVDCEYGVCSYKNIQ